jgi:soluble lytic murein transglycosylase-like protein
MLSHMLAATAQILSFAGSVIIIATLAITISGALAYGGHKLWTGGFLPAADRAYALTHRATAKFADLRGITVAEPTPRKIVVEKLVYVPEPLPYKLDENNACVVAIRLLAEKHGVPVQVPLTISHTESRFNPKAVNKNTNGTVDKGCMQINTSAHRKAFARPEDAFNATLNVDYGLRFLRQLYDETGDWRKAMVMFHSRTPGKQAKYRQHLNNSAKALDRQGLDSMIASID